MASDELTVVLCSIKPPSHVRVSLLYIVSLVALALLFVQCFMYFCLLLFDALISLTSRRSVFLLSVTSEKNTSTIRSKYTSYTPWYQVSPHRGAYIKAIHDFDSN